MEQELKDALKVIDNKINTLQVSVNDIDARQKGMATDIKNIKDSVELLIRNVQPVTGQV